MEEKLSDDPMHRRLRAADEAPRCGARTRSGSPCRQPAVQGKRRSRMHGGAAGSGGQHGNRNAWKHGARSSEALALRRYVRVLLKGSREIIAKNS